MEDVLCVWGSPVCRISWFVVSTDSTLLASPTADAAVRRARADAAWREAAADLDFVLYDLTPSAATDKRAVVDYGFLAAAPQPPRTAAQTVSERRAELRRWVQQTWERHAAANFVPMLRDASPALHFEYDSVLSAIGAGGPRAVRGVVLPSMDGGSGGAVVRLVIPLLLEHAEKTYQALNNLAVLYCKFAHHVWRGGYQVVSVEADLHVCIQVSGKKGRAAVLSEDVELRIVDQAQGSASPADSLVPFLRSCVDLHHLPRLSLAPPSLGFLDYLPQLDAALYRRIREPLHFMKLVLGLVADFGSPLELSVSCWTLACGEEAALQASPARKTAVFCVVDSATLLSFAVGLRYHSGEELPSVETTCTAYLDALHDAAVSQKVRYPRTGASMRKDDDGFVDVEELRMTVVHGVMECMASSIPAA